MTNKSVLPFVFIGLRTTGIVSTQKLERNKNSFVLIIEFKQTNKTEFNKELDSLVTGKALTVYLTHQKEEHYEAVFHVTDKLLNGIDVTLLKPNNIEKYILEYISSIDKMTVGEMGKLKLSVDTRFAYRFERIMPSAIETKPIRNG